MNRSKILYNDNPLVIPPSVAVAIGLNEAIVLQQIQYWISTSKNVRDGKVWVFNTYDQWQEQMPFWSVRTIKRIVDSLREMGVLLTTSEYNKAPFDRTLWYSIDYERLDNLYTESMASGEPNEYEDSDNYALSESDNLTPTIPIDYTETTVSDATHPAAVQDELFVVEEQPRPPKPKDHPAVQSYRELHGRYPTKAQMKMIVERNPDIDAWNRAMRSWVGRGYNPGNVEAVLDWSDNPSLMERRSKAQIKRDPTDGTTWQEMFDAQEEDDGSYKGPAYILPDGYME